MQKMTRKGKHRLLFLNLKPNRPQRLGRAPLAKLLLTLQGAALTIALTAASASISYAQNNASDQTTHAIAATTGGESLLASTRLSTHNLLREDNHRATLLSLSNVSHANALYSGKLATTNDRPKKWLASDYRISPDSSLISEESIRLTLQLINDEANNTNNHNYWIRPLQHKSMHAIQTVNNKPRSGSSALNYVLRKSIYNWWKSRNDFSVSRANDHSSALVANADNFSTKRAKSWDYGLRMSGSKVKLTLKRKL